MSPRLPPLAPLPLLLCACAAEPLSKPWAGTPRADETGQDAAPDSAAPDTSEDDTATIETGGGETSAGPVTLSYPESRVGMFYLTWHAYAAKAMARLPEPSGQTVEAVIAADGASFADLLYNDGLYDVAMAFHYHQEPEPGFYCLYRERDGEAPYDEPYTGPDCGDIAGLARTHATQLWEAGVDFVYVDLTNLPSMSAFSDVLGLRPFEVLLEEWSALRQAGVPTPQVAAWVPVSTVSADQVATLSRLLDVYAEHWSEDLLFRPDTSDAPVIFGVGDASSWDGTLVAEAAAAGVTLVPLWGLLSESQLAAGTAAWMQPCETGGVATTLIAPGTDCDQGWTSSSPLGSVVSVSRSYQLGYASLPLQASGRNGGLTFQKQMETALAARPDVLLINAWNEHIAQPQANPFDSSYGDLKRSMGATDVSDADASADWLWVDMYGEEFNRDFEPTVEGGDAGYQLLASCLRVYASGATTCSDAGEACCQLAEGWTLIYSLRGVGDDLSTDHLLTNNPTERDLCLSSGAWEEVGNPLYAPPELESGADTADGPFRLYPSGGAGRVALYRCYTGGGHFFSTDPACEGMTTEYTLGWMSATRSSETPRALTRCYHPTTGAHVPWLLESCPDGLSTEATLGYVR